MSKPTTETVTAALTRAGWPLATLANNGFRVRTMDAGIICVDYDPGRLPVDKDAAVTAMAKVLAAEGWMVTDAGRVLVSEDFAKAVEEVDA